MLLKVKRSCELTSQNGSPSHGMMRPLRFASASIVGGWPPRPPSREEPRPLPRSPRPGRPRSRWRLLRRPPRLSSRCVPSSAAGAFPQASSSCVSRDSVRCAAASCTGRAAWRSRPICRAAAAAAESKGPSGPTVCEAPVKASLKRASTPLGSTTAGSGSANSAASSTSGSLSGSLPFSWELDPLNISFKLLRLDLCRPCRPPFLPCFSSSSTCSPGDLTLLASGGCSLGGSSLRLRRLNLVFHPPDDGRCSLCRSWSVRACPTEEDGCTELAGLASCWSRLEGPCDGDPSELLGSSGAD